MAEPVSGPCGMWIDSIDDACCSDADKRADAITLATALLFRYSGRQYPGVCERVVRPCSAGGSCAMGRGQWPASWDYAIWDAAIGYWAANTPTYPARINGEWFNLPACGGNCYLPRLDSIPKPIVSVTEIVVDGTILDPAAYQVEANRAIVRLDGHGWPCSNQYALNSGPGGEVGTWQVKYMYGRGPGADGVVACKIFACEIAKFLCGSPCNLPSRIKDLSREGVGVILDPLTYIGNMETGIPIVDQWLSSVNPGKLQRRSTISRLDQPRQTGHLS